MSPIPPKGLYWVNERVAGSSKLRSIAEIKWLSLNGFKLVITLTEEPLPRELLSKMRDEGIHWLWEPIPDFSPPTLEQVSRILKAIFEVESEGAKVLVHCGAGLGRTGTVLACYLILKEFSAEQAIDRIRNIRPGAIESISQIAFIYNYERLVKRQKGH